MGEVACGSEKPPENRHSIYLVRKLFLKGDQDFSMKSQYNVGFLLINEYSSFNASFGLARVLKERGHKVHFIVTAGTVFPSYVNQNGFESSIMETKTFDRPEKNRIVRLWIRLKNHWKHIAHEQKGLSDLIEKNSLDLIFLDNLYSYPFAMVLAELHVPTILLFPNFGSRLTSKYPPVFSSMVPPAKNSMSTRYRFVYFCLWGWAIMTSGGRIRSLGILECGKIALEHFFLGICQLSCERKLRKLGWQSTWSEWSRRPKFPEVVFGHRALDWLGAASEPQRCYFGTTDIFRVIPSFDWREIESSGPLIYCNITMSGGFERIRDLLPADVPWKLNFEKKEFDLAKRFIDVIINAFSRRKDWQLILACGPYFNALNGATFPPNIHIFERVPQLAVLARCDLAVTWGGAGTIRECVNFGVPMLIFPVWTDQFGNAARVLFSSLGIRGNIQNVTPQKIINMIERAFGDNTIRSSTKEMRKKCNVGKELQGVVEFVRRHTSLEI
jgi:UDP:flavonoid glycosyltransferase YjiC (YdhE family)